MWFITTKWCNLSFKIINITVTDHSTATTQCISFHHLASDRKPPWYLGLPHLLRAPARGLTMAYLNSSHSGNTPATFSKLYRTSNLYESVCLRCCQTVYQVDRIGPLKDFTFYHYGCFKCIVCGTKLTLKTYFNNQHDSEDKQVYCSSHVPKMGPGHLDNSTVGIKTALNVPKSNNIINEQIRPGGKGK